jgi:hypothetical protein
MSRRIETGQSGSGVAAANAAPTRDDFMARVVKYIPTEIVGLYVAASGLVAGGTNEPSRLLWYVFGACALLTPLYLWRFTREPAAGKGPLWIQVILGTIAFPTWVFALGGPFVLLAWYSPKVAALVLIFVTFGLGFIEPAPGS